MLSQQNGLCRRQEVKAERQGRKLGSLVQGETKQRNKTTSFKKEKKEKEGGRDLGQGKDLNFFFSLHNGC